MWAKKGLAKGCNSDNSDCKVWMFQSCLHLITLLYWCPVLVTRIMFHSFFFFSSADLSVSQLSLSYGPPSVIIRPSIRLCPASTIHIFDFFSRSISQIDFKLGGDVSWGGSLASLYIWKYTVHIALSYLHFWLLLKNSCSACITILKADSSQQSTGSSWSSC